MNIEKDGIEILRDFISKESIREIIEEVGAADIDEKYGIRNAEKRFSSVKNLSISQSIQNVATTVLGAKPNLVRAIFFDKTPINNWLVTWHQDKTISVDAKADINNWGPWSIKDGVHHVQPDIEVLKNMITVRLHLDDANESNGCLKVIPSSHKYGIISQVDISKLTTDAQPYYCTVKAGDAVLMRPHILHSSSKSTEPGHRRVVHLEFSGYSLPMGLSWA